MDEPKFDINATYIFGCPTFVGMMGKSTVMDENELQEKLFGMLWAKSSPYKSLRQHSLETGAVAQTLISEGCFRPLKSELAEYLNITEEEAVALAGYMASMHDLGKIHPAFEGNGAVESAKKIIDENGIAKRRDGFRHELYGAKVLGRLWKDENIFPYDICIAFENVIRFHHQQPKHNQCSGMMDKDSLWSGIQKRMEKEMREMFPVPVLNDVRNIDTACMIILGVIITADWISSGEIFSGMPDECDDETLVKRSKATVKDFLIKNNMIDFCIPDVKNFVDLWPWMYAEGMRPLQSETEKMFAGGAEKPEAIIMEAPMGEGKTEAALYAAVKMAHLWDKTGFYVALPTAATSNQMWGRVNQMLQRLKLPGAKLMHSMAWMVDENTNSTFSGDCDNEMADLWTAPMRKGLIAPFAVGTIDQVMLAVTKARFSVLRLAGLADKVLIIDELHAYDVYMRTMIIRLLQWCRALHIPVIMLSATLPVKSKIEFSEVYSCSTETFSNLKSYPLITAFYENMSGKTIPVQGSHQHLNIRIRTKYILNNEIAVADFAECELKEKGGCICVLVNTVREAQTIGKLLKERLRKDVYVLHARFEAGRREELEKEITSLFGPDKTRRPERAILVATQILECSLDVDFDEMIIDLAPIDLLLQRIGRLWRHADTVRPGKIAEPIAIILTPADGDYGSSKYVYDELLLKRTEERIKNTDSIFIPGDIPTLVNDVYEIDENDETAIEYQINESVKGSQAEQYLLPEPNPEQFCLDSQGNFLDFGDEDASFMPVKTRLGDPTAKVAMLHIDLYERAVKAQRPDKKLAKEIMYHSITLRERMILKYMEISCVNGLMPVCGSGLLHGTWLLPSRENCCRFANDAEFVSDDFLGLIIKEG